MRQYWVAPLPPFHIADGPSVTAQAISDLSPTPSIVIPANALEVGSRLEFEAFGRFTTAASAGTLVMGIYLAASAAAIASGQALAITPAITMTNSVTTQSWRLEGAASVRAVGTSGSIIGLCEISGIPSVSSSTLAPQNTPTAVTYDTTVPLTVRLGTTMSLTGNTFIAHYFGARLVN